MKILVFVGFLVLMTIQSYAQIDPDKLLYLSKVEKYHRMKNTGALLTVGGTVLAIAGLVTLSNSTITTNYNGTTTTTGNPGQGFAAYLLGSAAVGAGIPLWIVGAHAEKKYNRKLENLSAGINLNQRRMGLTLTYRF